MIKRWQNCPVMLKMCKINICKRKILQKNNPHVYKNTVIEFNFHWNSNQKILYFLCKRVKIGTIIMIQINLYMHFLTLNEEQHSTTRNIPRILFVYIYSMYFSNFIYWVLKYATIIVNNTSYFIMVVPECTVSGTNEC